VVEPETEDREISIYREGQKERGRRRRKPKIKRQRESRPEKRNAGVESCINRPALHYRHHIFKYSNR
jgi:hypothetical protein